MLLTTLRGAPGVLRPASWMSRNVASLIHANAKAPLSSLSSSSSSSSVSASLLRLQHHQTRTYATEIWKNTKSSELGTALARGKELYKTYKAFTNGMRHVRRPLNDHLYPGKPLRFLTVAKRKNGGRNHHGVITVRHRGGGHKQRIRVVDYYRQAPGVHDVVRIEYDPNRSAHIALVKNRDASAEQVYSYIIATEGMRAGDEIRSFREGIPDGFIPGFEAGGGQGTEEAAQSLAVGLLRSLTLKPGNVLPLRLIPTGTVINSVSLRADGPGILVRSAGSFAQVVLNDGHSKYVHVKLQSGEVRKVLRDCCATIGKVSNPLWKNRSLGKAGRARWLGIRPTVRGVAMNANDHPHGGGRGKSKSNKHPVSIWGWGTKGTRTRKPGPKGPKNSNKMVIRERPRGKEKRGL